MAEIRKFTFNYFFENTYIIYDSSGECAIIDPGCSSGDEEKELMNFIKEKGLTPVYLLNTHCHIDHIFGNRFIAEKYALPLHAHKDDMYNIKMADLHAEQFGMPSPQSPMPEKFLNDGDLIKAGNTELKVLFTPGHSAGHVVLHCEKEKFVIGGDVLFRESIGRTDLPGGDYDTLISSIREKLFALDDDTEVHPGHGPSTTIGYEKKHNPFLNE